MKKIYTACFYPEEGSYTVIFPDLPGATTCGDTLEQAMEMAVDCAAGWLTTLLEDGHKLPASTPFDDLSADEFPGGFKSRILIDLDLMHRVWGSQTVERTVTLPYYLNHAVEREGFDLSLFLRKALEEHFSD